MLKKISFLIIMFTFLLFSCASTGKQSTVKSVRSELKGGKLSTITPGKVSQTKIQQSNKPSTKFSLFSFREKKPAGETFKNIDFGKKIKFETIVLVGIAGIVISLSLKLLKA
ncbi:MAG: hypothetical protein ACP5QT_04915 [Brevinematia bacterium]